MSTLPTQLELLSSYVPALLTRHVLRQLAPLDAPQIEQIHAAVLFADISGFVPLADRLTDINNLRTGPAGAEALSTILNNYFGQLIDLITAHGGEVVKFAGDALTAIWPAPGPAALPDATTRAAACGLTIQQQLHNFPAADDVHLSLRIGIAAGPALSMIIGGVTGRWELLLTGDPIVEMGLANEQAQPGQVALSRSAFNLLRGRAVTSPLRNDAYLLASLNTSLPLVPAQLPHLAGDIEAGLRAYIPPTVLSRLDAGQTTWLAEIRRVTVLFVNLPNLRQTSPSALDQIQTVMRSLQDCLYRYEGSFNKLSIDDKGTTFIAALGLPPLSHEDDPERAVRAALEMKSQLLGLGMRSAIGIATGQVFCGTVGNTTRREYTLIGAVVNLASRIMQVASRYTSVAESILCDRATYDDSHTNIEYKELAPIAIKGKTEPIDIFRPLGARARAVGQRYIIRPRFTMVGRDREHQLVAEQLRALKTEAKDGVLILEGEMGIGKSRLIEDLRQQAEQMGITAFFGAGSAIEKNTPYLAWRSVFSQLLDLDVMTDPRARHRHVLDLLELEPQLFRLAPLLNPVLGLDLPETDDTANMTSQARTDNTRVLLIQLLQTSVDRSAKVVILEDAQWLDSASWYLASFVSEWVHPLLLVIALRPVADRSQTRLDALDALPETRHLRLKPLSPIESADLIAQRLGVPKIAPEITNLIFNRAEGQPFLTIELADAFLASGVLKQRNGVYELPDDKLSLQQLNFPSTIQGMITSRIDRLTPGQQMTLKTASVIGRLFSTRLLEHIYPLDAYRLQIHDHLDTLRAQEILALVTVEPEKTYSFKQPITQEVAYQMMPFAQRRGLHRAIAEWYETTYADDLAAVESLLSHHWYQAEELDKAIIYSERAAERALQGGNYQEAMRLFARLLDIENRRVRRADPTRADLGDTMRQITSSQVRSAYWERKLGEASYLFGNLTESDQHLRNALLLLNHSWPPPQARRAGNLNQQIIRALATSLGWHPAAPTTPEAHSATLEAARAAEKLAQIQFARDEIELGAHACAYGLNLANTVDDHELTARLTADLAWALTLLNRPRLAGWFIRRATHQAQTLSSRAVTAHHTLTQARIATARADWPTALTACDHSARTFEQAGLPRNTEDPDLLKAAILACQGDFPHSRQTWQRLHTAAQRRGDRPAASQALRGQALAQLRLSAGSALPQTLQLLERSTALLEDAPASLSASLAAHGLHTALHLRMGSRLLAREQLTSALQTLGQRQFRPSHLIYLDGLSELTLAAILLWQHETQTHDTPVIAQAQVEHLLAGLDLFATRFVAARPHAQRLHGHFQVALGDATAAANHFQRAIQLAEKAAMPYEAARAYHALAAHSTPGAASRQALSRACAIFAELGTVHDLEAARADLAKHGGN